MSIIDNGLVDYVCSGSRYHHCVFGDSARGSGSGRPANRWPRASPSGSRWRHWRLFEQRIRRPRFACGRRYGISGWPCNV